MEPTLQQVSCPAGLLTKFATKHENGKRSAAVHDANHRDVAADLRLLGIASTNDSVTCRLSKGVREELVAQQEFIEHPEFYSGPSSGTKDGAQRSGRGKLTLAGDECLPVLQSLVRKIDNPATPLT